MASQNFDDPEEFENSSKSTNVERQRKCEQNAEIQKLIDENNSFEAKYKKLEQQFNQNKEYFESRCNELEQKLKDERSQILSLEKRNGELEKEASNYQSALGVATSFNLSDEDQNHTVRLNQDILALHDTLENYVTNLKPKINVDIKVAKQILRKYKCQTEISDKDPNKPVIKAALQRHVLEEIMKQADFYFTRSNMEHYLESEIVSKTVELTNLMEKFYKNRLGDDRVTRHTPIKLRQQVYSALGTRGFNDITSSNGTSSHSKHDFIYTISKKINKMMNKVRVIKDVEKRRYVDALAGDLVRDVVRIFYFRLKIQEPMAQYLWYENNERINKSTMKSSWDDDDDIDDMVVEVCSFPLIFKPDGFKVYTPAKVYACHIRKQSVREKFFNASKSIGHKLTRFYSGGENSNLSIDSVNTYDYDTDQIDSDAETSNNEVI